ncbi:MAG: HPr kinase/phosphorylase [Leptospiraceae bacterium]|nr:HPr kinase/phosphorylase [Leptospiraceae bacterium]MCP5497615.1 HPr kinase/phosphorylase [Leptospiraceae bacterium]
METITIENLFHDHPELHLSLVSGGTGLYKKITSSDINRPGLSLTGFFRYFAHDRIQIFGKGEWAYLHTLSKEVLHNITEKFFSYSLNCLIFTHGNIPQDEIIQKSKELSIPIFTSPIDTQKFIIMISGILNRILAPKLMRHGVLIEVFGIGTLLTGKSGVGKSECALELIERGHRLVADDMVEIRRISESYLLGTCSHVLRHHMEIRGLGIINIPDIFGVGSIRDHKILDLIINIEEWNKDMEYDRTGLDDSKIDILGIEIAFLKIPVKPGRNLPILVETAAINQRLKKMGNYTAKEFNNRLTDYIEQNKIERINH